ncbi:hypothetical protein D3C81_2063120 [compost metagenome]
MRVGQFAHRCFQFQHRQHLPQLIVNLAGNSRLLFFTHAFKVRRQFAQLLAGGRQFQLDALALADVPDDAVPHVRAVLQLASDRFDLGPALLALTREDPALP